MSERCNNWKENNDQARRDWKERQDERCEEWEERWECDEIEEKWQCDKFKEEWVCDVEEEKKKCDSWSKWTAWLCIGWSYVKTGVCLAGRWVATGVCKVGQWVETGVCLAGRWITTGVCKVWGEVANAGWWIGSGIGWIACTVYDAVIKPVVDWILEAFGVCTSRRKVSGIERLQPRKIRELTPEVLNFKNGKKPILCLDGGGVRGIVTLQALKALEDRYSVKDDNGEVITGMEARCIDMFDMFAGTSTGAIIAGALAWGVSVDELIKLYHDKHKIIFTKSKRRIVGGVIGGVVGALGGAGIGGVLGPAGAIVGGIGGAIGGAYAGAKIILPWYDNKAIICILKSIFENDTLAHCHKDLLITSKDTIRNETTYFTSFHPTPRPSSDEDLDQWLDSVRGTYKDISLASAIASSAASAPLYFKSVGRFIDGGVGNFNNVSYAAPVEALRYSAKMEEIGRIDDFGQRNDNGNWPIYDKIENTQLYEPGKVKVLAFGTGKTVINMEVGEAKKIKTPVGWLAWIIPSLMDDSSEQQSYIAQNDLDKYQGLIEFQRFQLFWSERTRTELENILTLVNIDPATQLEFDSFPSELDKVKLELDAVKHFELLDKIGQVYGRWLNLPDIEPRFEKKGGATIGDPVKSDPPSFHIDVYSSEVKSELENEI